MNIDAVKEMFKAFEIKEYSESFEESIKELE